MSISPQRKKLPVNPSIEHLQKQAKRLAKESPALQLSAAQHKIAKEYGCKNWAELAQMVTTMSRPNDPERDRRFDAMPKAARAQDFEEVMRMVKEGDFTPLSLDQTLAHTLWYGEASTWPSRKAIADFLLDHGADPSGQYGSEGYGPIVFGAGECIQPEALEWLIAKGVDVRAQPVETKYGRQCIVSHLLGTYGRGANERKHRCLDLLLREHAYVPPEVSAPILAIHRGHADELVELLDADRSLVSRTFPDMPYGNISLLGATLLHCAVEFGENACIDELLKRNANINARSEIIDGVGGQTPIFHAIATNAAANLHTLEFLAQRAGAAIDMSIQATFRLFDKPQPHPITPMEFAESSLGTSNPNRHIRGEVELALLRELASK